MPPNSHYRGGFPSSKPPSGSPLYRRLEQLYGPIPPPTDSNSFQVCSPLLRLLNERLGEDAGCSLAMLIGEWAGGITIIEAMAGRGFHKGNRKAVRKLAHLGFISYDDKLDLATLNEDVVLAYLNQITEKG